MSESAEKVYRPPDKVYRPPDLTKAELTAWTAALRSAACPQCHGTFRTGDARCALGILQDQRAGDARLVLAELGSSLFCKVSMLNDGDRLPFAAIADWLDAHVVPCDAE